MGKLAAEVKTHSRGSLAVFGCLLFGVMHAVYNQFDSSFNAIYSHGKNIGDPLLWLVSVTMFFFLHVAKKTTSGTNSARISVVKIRKSYIILL